MRTLLIATASALALLSGGALAQGAGGSGTGMTTDSPAGMISPNLASAQEMMGKTVIGSDGQEIGEVEDVIIDPQAGQARQLVISSGGFLGIGDRQVAVDFNTAQLDPANDQVKLSNLTRQNVQSLPEFQYGEGVTSLSRRQAPDTTPPADSAPR